MDSCFNSLKAALKIGLISKLGAAVKTAMLNVIFLSEIGLAICYKEQSLNSSVYILIGETSDYKSELAIIRIFIFQHRTECGPT